MRSSISNLLHEAFNVTIFLKAINGLVEIFGGFFLLSRSAVLGNLARFIFSHELASDPTDVIANFFINLASNITPNAKIFGSIYLIGHGIINLILVVGLWKKKSWSYIAAEIVFMALFAYEIYRFYFRPSYFLIFLIVLDIVAIGLIFVEHNFFRKSKPKHLYFVQ